MFHFGADIREIPHIPEALSDAALPILPLHHLRLQKKTPLRHAPTLPYD